MCLAQGPRIFFAIVIVAFVLSASGCLSLLLGLTAPNKVYVGDLEIASFEPVSANLQGPEVVVRTITTPGADHTDYSGYSDRQKTLRASQRYGFGYRTVEVLSKDVTVRVLNGTFHGGVRDGGLTPATHYLSVGIENRSGHDLHILGQEATFVPTEWYATRKFKVPDGQDEQLNQPVLPKEAYLLWDAPPEDIKAVDGLVIPPEGAESMAILSGHAGVLKLQFRTYPVRSGYFELPLRIEGLDATMNYRFLLTGTDFRRMAFM